MAQNTFIDAVTPADYTAAVRSISSQLGKATEFGGYNRCFARETAEVLLQSRDEYTAPLAAVGQAGLGRVSVLTAEADGEYTGKFAADPDAGTLLSSLANWMLTPDDNSGDFLIAQSLYAGSRRVSIHLDPNRERDPWRGRPVLTGMTSRPGETPRFFTQQFDWVGPDELAATTLLDGDAIYLGTVSWEGGRPIALAPAALPYSPEFRPETGSTAAAAALTAELSELTGGVERIVPDEVWRDLPRQRRYLDLTPYFLALALLLLLLEVAERRLNLLSRLFRRRQAVPGAPPPPVAGRPKKSRRGKAKAAPPPELPPEPAAAPEPEAPPEISTDLSEALRKARNRSRR